MKTLSESLKQKKKKKIPHLIIEARAGTGKTTTLIEGLKLVTRKGVVGITPSKQQEAIWEAMEKSRGNARSVCFVAFNKSIATELQERVPEGCHAMTMHSMGFKAVRQAFDSVKVNGNRVQDIIAEILGKDIWEIRKKDFELLKATEKLVGLCKMNLTGYQDTCGWRSKKRIVWLDAQTITADKLSELASHYDVDLNSNSSRVFDLVPRVLERCKDVQKDGCIDFNDMVWLPVVLDLDVERYDLLLVDEAQDLNRCQHQLILKSRGRVILCGDPKQAIYGFAGADSKSMDNMMRELSITDVGCEYLQLTVTRRCGRAIVKEAQKIVPDFQAHRSCCDGLINRASMELKDEGCLNPYHIRVQDGDMILCRVNAPLVSECFKFLRNGRKANIQGRDVGQGLISTIRKVTKNSTKNADVGWLLVLLSDWLQKETQRENAKRNPSESRLIALQDRHDCIVCFCEGQSTVSGVIEKIESVFTDDKNGSGILLSSVHKAKGLESKRVFILQPENAGMPHPVAKGKWQIEQEYNLLYVAITRAIEELIFVS